MTDLKKLIPMLSSDNDGEVVATVRAIDRLLKSCGKDWHWIADQIKQPKEPAPGFTVDGYHFPWNRPSRRSARSTYSVAECCSLLSANIDQLTSKQVKFVNSMRSRSWEELSPAQINYLSGLVDIIRKRARQESRNA